MIDIPALLQQHVYTAVVLGSMVEGETTAVLAGYAAHQGHASWWAVTALVALVNFFWDQAWFALGHSRGPRILERFPRLAAGVQRVQPRLQRHRRWFTFGVRFMYGLRTAGPLALGLAGVPWREFIFFNALGALAWAMLFTGLGWAFGRSITAVLGSLGHDERLAALVLVAAAAVVAWVRHRRSRRGAAGPG
jgi:membrane protein DedA with SNARE-associated domain